MNAPPCLLLDDYLAHDLDDAEAARFADHLAECPACRRAVHENERLTALLTAAADRLTPVPAGLTERVGRRLQSVRRRRFAATAAALTAALAAAAAVLWWLGHPAPRVPEPERTVAEVRPQPPAPEAPGSADRVRVTFPAGANVVAVPVPTESPNVTFVWVYHGLRAASRPAAGPPSSPERNRP
jgi:anti-sigma factor RsiW